MLKYISFALMQIIFILLSGYISGLANFIFTLLAIPFSSNRFIDKALSYINVFFQNYITVSILLTNIILYAFVNLHMNITLLTLISLLLCLLSIQSSASAKHKNENDYQMRTMINRNFLLSIFFSVLLFVLMSMFKNLIWSTPGELIYKFLAWIQDIKVLGPIFSFAINIISILCLTSWMFSLLIILAIPFGSLFNKARTDTNTHIKELGDIFNDNDDYALSDNSGYYECLLAEENGFIQEAKAYLYFTNGGNVLLTDYIDKSGKIHNLSTSKQYSLDDIKKGITYKFKLTKNNTEKSYTLTIPGFDYFRAL